MRRVRLDEARSTSPRHSARARTRRRSRLRRRGGVAPISIGLRASMLAGRKPCALPFLEAVADAVQGLDHVEAWIDGLELLPQPLDVAVDGAIVHVDLIVVSGVHERVAALHHAGALR